MKNKIGNILRLLLLCCAPICFTTCGIYSFSGTSIQADVETITIDFMEYKALKVNPQLANQLTEGLRDIFHKRTKLEEVDSDGDLELSGAITGYDVSATSITAEETAARNRLTVKVKITFTNRKYPEDDFEKDFSAYADFDATQLLDAVQDTLCEEIIKILVEDIFTASVAQW